MKKTALASALIVASFLSASALASESNFSYTYLEGSIEALSFDEDIYVGNVVYDGIAGASVAGSYQFNRNLYAGAKGSYLQNDGWNTELNVSQATIFVGAAFGLGNMTDIFMQAGASNLEAEACIAGMCYKEDDNQLMLETDLRHLATNNIELNA